MSAKRPTDETPFEAALRSAIMQSFYTFDALERASGVSSQAIGRFVTGTRGLTCRSAGLLMESMNLVVLCKECHEKLGKTTVNYVAIEVVARPAPKPRGRPFKLPRDEASSGHRAASERQAEPNPSEERTAKRGVGRGQGKILSIEHIIPAEREEAQAPKKRGRPPKSRQG